MVFSKEDPMAPIVQIKRRSNGSSDGPKGGKIFQIYKKLLYFVNSDREKQCINISATVLLACHCHAQTAIGHRQNNQPPTWLDQSFMIRTEIKLENVV